MKKDEEQAIIPMERYNELLKKEEIFNKNSIQLTFWSGSWTFANLIWFKGDDASKKMIEEIQTAYKLKKETEEDLEEVRRKFSFKDYNFQLLEKRVKKIESTWWYKFFTYWSNNNYN